MSKSFSSLLDLCRWLAAFLVVIEHARHIMFIEYKEIANPSNNLKLFYFVTGLGHEAVVIFFILSGYLVGGITVTKWSNQTNFKEYFVSRFSRIYPVLIPSLIIGGILDWSRLNIINNGNIIPIKENDALNLKLSGNIDIETFFGNLFSLQGIKVPIFGSNGPLWSLAWEWWYYIIFAVFLGCIVDKNINLKIINLSVLILIVLFIPSKILAWMFIWLLGVGVYIYNQLNLKSPPIFFSTIQFLIAFCLSRFSHNTDNMNNPNTILIDIVDELIRDFAFGLCFSILLLSCYKRHFFIPLTGLHNILAKFSFSIYLFHFPMLVFIITACHETVYLSYLQQPTWRSGFIFCGLILLLYVYCYIIYLFTEKHSAKVKIKLSTFINKNLVL